MLLPLVFLLFNQDTTRVDLLARQRNTELLSRMLAPLPSGVRNPIEVVRTNGAYQTGRFGWRALEGRTPGNEDGFIVLTTPLTSEDVGELVFRKVDDKLEYLPETDSLGMRIVRHDFEVALDPTAREARITDRIKVRKTGANRPYFLFRMSPHYRVASVEDGGGQPIVFSQIGGTVFLPTPGTVETDYTVRYVGAPNLRLYAGSIGDREASLTNDYWYPLIARQPAPYSLEVRAPKSWTIVAQGEPVSVQTEGEETVAKYRMDLPVVFYSLAAGEYRSMSRDVEGKRYSVWGVSLQDGEMSDQLELLPPVVQFFEKKFGVWPFARFGMLQSNVYGFGALEAYSFATYGGGIPMEDPHEVSHTLFGGVLNNSYLKSFWNESFASFSEGFYRREVEMGSREERREAFVETPSVNPRYNDYPISDAGADVGNVAGDLGYGKGGYVLQMLERLVGTETFVRSVSRWLKERPTDRTVEWSDFESVVTREAPNSPVKAFFDDWVYRPGYVIFDIVDVRMSGSNVSATLEFKGRSFTLPLEVMLVSPDGRREFVTVPVAGRPRKVELSIPAPFRPSLVTFDPWRRLLRPISAEESPAEFATLAARMQVYSDPAQKDFLSSYGRGRRLDKLPSDLNQVFLIGHPDSTPQMRALCQKVGFEVSGNSLTYKGTTIDLTKGGAVAIVDLDEGRRCAIGLGRTRTEPILGRARLALFDEYGRFLRGLSEPKTTGPLTFRL
ncbi:MAG TPA: M1 family aminopeptidase [Fimbriimonas sp.]